MKNKIIRIIIIILSVILIMLAATIVIIYRQRAAEPDRELPPDIIVETPGLPQNEVQVASIRVVLESYEILKGTRFMPEVIILPDNATDKNFELKSDNLRVLRQQGNNWVATEVGTANLIATASNGTTGMAIVVVIAPEAEEMSFQEEEITMVPGNEFELIPSFIPRDAGIREPIVYTSTNERVATVSNYGIISAVGSGTTIITGRSGSIRAEIKVTVSVPVRSITITLERTVFSIGEQAEFSIKVEPENATNKEVAVTFSGAAITSARDNAFRCDEAGEVTITATSEDNPSINNRINVTVLNLTALADEVFRLSNIERANYGAPSLGRVTRLTDVALLRAREIREPNQFSHTRPDGREFHTAFMDIGLAADIVGENIAEGYTGPAEVVKAWMESPDHRANLLNRDFGNLGVGVTINNAGKLYWAQMFMN